MKSALTGIRLKLKYGWLTPEGCLLLLEDLLKNGEASRYAGLRDLVLDRAMALRPEISGYRAIPPEDRRWGHWAAMALRCFPALATPPSEMNTIPNVRGWLAYDAQLLQALLFGDRDLVAAILAAGFDAGSWRASLPPFTPAQEQVISILQYPLKTQNLTDRQVLNWTRAFWPEWAEAIHARLRLPFVHRLAGVLGPRGSRGSVAEDEMRAYTARFKENGPEWAYGIALSYLSEREHRFSRVLRHASRVLPLAGAALACVVPALLSPEGSILRLLLVGISLSLVALSAMKLTLSVLLLVSYNARYMAHLAILERLSRESPD